jgi:hypothetical protein
VSLLNLFGMAFSCGGIGKPDLHEVTIAKLTVLDNQYFAAPAG